MDLAEIFQKIYSGKGVVKKHLTLFSIVGILALLGNCVVSYNANSLFSSMITVAPSEEEVKVFLAFVIYFWAYIFGYEYKFINSVMNSENIELPQFESNVLDVFIKMFPVFLVWQIYFFIISYFTGKYTLLTNNLLCYFIFGTIMLFFTPFVFMLYVKFAKDFKYGKDVFLPWAIVKNIDRGLVDVVVLGVKYFLYVIIPVAFFTGYFEWVFTMQAELIRLVAYLIGICFAAYVFVIYKLVYGVAIAKIVKEKIINRE